MDEVKKFAIAVICEKLFILHNLTISNQERVRLNSLPECQVKVINRGQTYFNEIQENSEGLIY